MKVITIKNNYLQAEVLDYGATLMKLLVPDNKGKIVDVVLGYDDPHDYEFSKKKNEYFGCIVGRVANRIAKGQFELDGRKYQLAINNGVNALHGGVKQSFSHKTWEIVQVQDSSVKLSIISYDQEEGYPGTIEVFVTYSLTDQNSLKIQYEARLLDRDRTIINLSNHSYFNLSGFRKSPDINDHLFQINSSQYLEFDPKMPQIPSGRILPVDGTPLDLRNKTCLNQKAQFLKDTRGYDHSYVCKPETLAAIVESNETGIRLKLKTTEPSIQFYTANWLDSNVHNPAKQSHKIQGYAQYSGFCLEAQKYVDAINHAEQGWDRQVILNRNDTYFQTTEYFFESFDT